MPKIQFVSTALLALGLLSACATPTVTEQDRKAGEYVLWLGDNKRKVVYRDSIERLVSLTYTVEGEEGCFDSYHPSLENFAIFIVFGSMNYNETKDIEGHDETKNPHLFITELDSKSWDERCRKMVKLREEFLGCSLSQHTPFTIGIYTEHHLAGSQKKKEKRILDAFRFRHADRYLDTTRESPDPKSDCV